MHSVAAFNYPTAEAPGGVYPVPLDVSANPQIKAGIIGASVYYDSNDIAEPPIFYLNPSGDSSLNGLTMNGKKITNVTDPTANQDAATKAYVDLICQ